MCLYIKSGPHIAGRDILVWKVLCSDNSSLHREFDYVPNKTYKPVELRVDRAYNAIHAGYHSFRSRHVARTVKNYTGQKVVKFTIPKGAKYYIGNYEERVSSIIRSGDLKAQ